MTDLSAHGIEISLPNGWEGRLFRRPMGGEVASAAANIRGVPAAAEEMTQAVLQVATIALAPGVGDFASGAVDTLGENDILIVLFEHDTASVRQPLFEAKGIPRALEADDFSPNVMQRAIRGQCGVQRFFNDGGRAFCLYVVLGSFARRRENVGRVNQVLASLTIDPPDAATTPTTTTAAPMTTAAQPSTTTTELPSTTTTVGEHP